VAKTISKRKSSSSRARAARLSRAVATNRERAVVSDDLDDLPEDELAEDDTADASDEQGDEVGDGDDEAYEDDEEVDGLALSDDEIDRSNSRAVALSPNAGHAPAPAYQRGGIWVPEFLMGNPVTRWLAEAYIELRKAVWPTFTEARNMTIIVISISAAVAIILGLADLGLTKLVTWLTGLAG